MERYIDVEGEGQFEEEAKTYVAHLKLGVRAVEKQAALREIGDFRTLVVRALLAAGLLESELSEAGFGSFVPWYQRKQVGQLSESTIRLQVNEYDRLTKALESLEALQDGFDKRRTIEVEMRQPVFEDSSAAHSAALKAACRQARAKAEELAGEMGCRVGAVLILREGQMGRRGSGFGSDYDWGDSDRFYSSGMGVLCADGPLEESAPPVELQRPKRTIFVRVAARFSLVS